MKGRFSRFLECWECYITYVICVVRICLICLHSLLVLHALELVCTYQANPSCPCYIYNMYFLFKCIDVFCLIRHGKLRHTKLIPELQCFCSTIDKLHMYVYISGGTAYWILLIWQVDEEFQTSGIKLALHSLILIFSKNQDIDTVMLLW